MCMKIISQHLPFPTIHVFNKTTTTARANKKTQKYNNPKAKWQQLYCIIFLTFKPTFNPKQKNTN